MRRSRWNKITRPQSKDRSNTKAKNVILISRSTICMQIKDLKVKEGAIMQFVLLYRNYFWLFAQDKWNELLLGSTNRTIILCPGERYSIIFGFQCCLLYSHRFYGSSARWLVKFSASRNTLFFVIFLTNKRRINWDCIQI